MRFAVAVADDIIVLFLDLVELDLQLDHLVASRDECYLVDQGSRGFSYLLAAVLQISHEGLLHSIKLSELDADCLSGAFEVLSALS